MKKPVFLDRDGVINRRLDNDYVKSWSEFEFLPGVFEALQILNNSGYSLILVSNQAGVAKGLMSITDLRSIDTQMKQELIEHDVYLLNSYYCRHRDEDGCLCRKPQSGLFFQACDDYNLDLHNAWIVGDSECDIQAGHETGCRGILLTPSPVKTSADYSVTSLLEATQLIVKLTS